MKSQRYKGLFEDWEVGIATNAIERLRKDWACLRMEGFEDLIQECLIHWHFSKDDYDPLAGTNRRTFMVRVVEHKLRHIIEKLTAGKRKASIDNISLDERISDEEDSPTNLDQLPVDEEYFSNLRLSAELKIDLSRTYQKLSPKQRELCRLLGQEGLSIQEASQVLKTPRGTLYEDIKRIKAIFQKENLHEYLG